MTLKLNTTWLLGWYLLIYSKLLDASKFSLSKSDALGSKENFNITKSDAFSSSDNYDLPKSDFGSRENYSGPINGALSSSNNYSVPRSDVFGSKDDYNVPRSNFFRDHSSRVPKSTKDNSRVPRSLRGQFLEQMNEKCERESRSNQQSYLRSYCFQYNTLSHIHYLLSFGEELLQIGPIDLIYLKSSDLNHPIHPPLREDSIDKTPLIVYPENKHSLHTNRDQSEHPPLETESRGETSRQNRGGKALENVHNDTKHGHIRNNDKNGIQNTKTETRRDTSEQNRSGKALGNGHNDKENDHIGYNDVGIAGSQFPNTESGKELDNNGNQLKNEDENSERFNEQRNEDAIQARNVGIKNQDHEKRFLIHDISEAFRNDLKAERKDTIQTAAKTGIETYITNDGNRNGKATGIYRTHGIRNGKDYYHPDSIYHKTNNENTGVETYKTNGIRNGKSYIPDSNYYETVNDNEHEMKGFPEARSLHGISNNDPDERQIQMLNKIKEKSYFLHYDEEEDDDDDGGSSAEDMVESMHEIRHLPIKLSPQPIGNRQKNNLHQGITNINPNKTKQINLEPVEGRENFNGQELLDLTNEEITRKTLKTEHKMENNDTNETVNSGKNCNDGSNNTRNLELSQGCTEHFVESQTDPKPQQQNRAPNEEHVQFNEQSRDGNGKDNSNGDKKPDTNGNPDFYYGSSIGNRDKHGDKVDKNTNSDENSADIYYESTERNPNVYYESTIESGGKNVYGTNEVDIEGTRKAKESMKSLHESNNNSDDSSFSWLGNLDQIAQRLNDIFSTYGITIPIPDWSEDLPSIIPLDENDLKKGEKKESDLRMSRRRHHSKTPKKYMALFPLVAVLKFMMIKALLVPLLISVLIIKKILILGVIALPYVFSLLRICRNGPGFGFLFGGGGGAGGGVGGLGNQVAANAPYLSAVDTAVDYTAAYNHPGFGGGAGAARWIDRHYPNMIGGHHGGSMGKLSGEVGLIERKKRRRR